MLKESRKATKGQDARTGFTQDFGHVHLMPLEAGLLPRMVKVKAVSCKNGFRSQQWLAMMLLVGVALLGRRVNADEPDKKVDTGPLASKVAKLIEELGARQYAARIRAQRKLEQLGLSAFDALHDAQNHDDVEIAMRARFLIRSMRIDWATDDDSTEVRRILRGYGRCSIAERKNRMERLSQLDEFDGIKALCRLVRYETDSKLSRRAALLLMETKGIMNEHKPRVVKIINTTLQASSRPAAQWALAFGATMTSPEQSLARWRKICRDEQLTLSQFPGRTTRHLLRDLLRWRAKLLQELKREEEYTTVARETMGLLDGTESELSEMVDWLIFRKSWSLAEELAEAFPSEFSRNGVLLYRLAEAFQKKGDKKKANEMASRALKINADDIASHLEIAEALRRRGSMEWSVNEFQHVIKNSKSGSNHNVQARLVVSEVLHDFDRDQEAGESLKGIVDLLDRPEVTRLVTQTFRRDPNAVRSRMNYFMALHRSRTDVSKARELLKAGLAKDPNDPDILIAMFRQKGADDKWKAETKRSIESAIKFFEQQRKTYATGITNADDESTRRAYQLQLALANNQLAWLIGNTMGDIDLAIRCSHESLKLRPQTSAYLDTLGRCYYTKGDYENAVKYQRKAVELEPTSGQIRRQLELFEKALQTKKRGKP